MKLRYLLFTLLLTSCGRHIPTEETAFYKIQVSPVMNGTKQFVASGQHVSLFFQSDRNDLDAVDFPEPPVVVNNKKTGSSCEITGGGIWARSEVYLSADERYVLMYEFSGSSGDLASYDTQTCRQIMRLEDVSMRWEINGFNARLGENCNPDIDGWRMNDCAESKPLDLNLFVEENMAPEK